MSWVSFSRKPLLSSAEPYPRTVHTWRAHTAQGLFLPITFFSPSSLHTVFPPCVFLLSIIQRPAVILWGSISTRPCTESSRAAVILLLSSSWWTNVKKKNPSMFHGVKNEQDRYKFPCWEKTGGLLPGYPSFSLLCCWRNCSVIEIINALRVSVCYSIHTVAGWKKFSQADLEYVQERNQEINLNDKDSKSKSFCNITSYVFFLKFFY